MPPAKYFVPNSFTAASLLLGLASVVMSSKGHFELAAWMILWGTLLDKADGTVARLMKATSDFGIQFDSFADFVAFGIAPAALVYFRLSSSGAFDDIRYAAPLMAAAGLYVVALAIRLARFNITTGGEKVFYGLPGTLMGAIVAAGYLTWNKYQLDPAILRFSPAYLLIGAALMVSSLRLPKLAMRKNKLLNAFQMGNVAAAYVLGPAMLMPEYLLGLAVLYSVVGVSWCLLHPEPEQRDSLPERVTAT